mgnify:FL=1
MKEVSDFISTVGFPIVVCLLMIYQQEKMSQSYIDIVQSLKELISDNTKAISLLINRAKENDQKLVDFYNKNMGGVNNEDKQETSTTISDNQ